MTEHKNWPIAQRAADGQSYTDDNEQIARSFTQTVTLLSNRTLQFSKRPEKPPFELLDFISKKFDVEIKNLGGRTDDPDLLMKINKVIFPEGRRQEIIEGHRIRWRQGKAGLRDLIMDRLPGFDGQLKNILFEIFWLQSNGSSPILDNWHELPDGPDSEVWRIFTAILAELSFNTSIQKNIPAETLSEWDKFDRLLSVQCEKFENLVIGAINDERVIVAQGEATRSVLVSADTILKLEETGGDGYWFALSCDIPEAWWKKAITARQITKGKEWLFKAREHFAEEDRRFAQNVAKEALFKRFGITEHVFKTNILEEYQQKYRVRKGNTLASSKVKLSELLDFN